MVRGPDASHGFRAILPNEILFDVGDSGDWERCRRTTHAIWRVLNKWGVPYWGALSGGSGTHTHVFLGKRPTVVDKGGPADASEIRWSDDLAFRGDDLRETIAEWVVRFAHEREPLDVQFVVEDHWEHLDVDRVKVAPGPNKSVVRAFGSRNERRKTLWTFGPGAFPLLRPSRGETYNNHHTVVPSRLPVSTTGTPGVKHAMIAKARSGGCPRGPECFPGAHVTGPNIACRRCPADM